MTRLIGMVTIEVWGEGPPFGCPMLVAITLATERVGGMGVGETQGGVLGLEWSKVYTPCVSVELQWPW